MSPELPDDVWRSPVQDCEPTLPLFSTEDILARLRVSRDEVRHWWEQRWLSFDADSKPKLMLQETWEVEFVRNIARSGLSDPQIHELLRELPKPLKYDPVRTAYHFGYGWVMPLQYHHFDIVDAHVSEWIEELGGEADFTRLTQLLSEIEEQLSDIEQEDETEEE